MKEHQKAIKYDNFSPTTKFVIKLILDFIEIINCESNDLTENFLTKKLNEKINEKIIDNIIELI